MAVFRMERNRGYTVMSNHHLRSKELTLKAKGLLSQMLSLPEMLMYSKEASNRKPEIDRQHHTIPNQRNQRPKDKHCGNVHNRLWNHG